ncbi:hypothetical protein ACJIZ3_017946 [Penstemon smallii]|uniref:Uncharacterized protein n=1 Tax=Penstemon smallii TaxID=265156 RepID=A0ABD3SX07_9LAMI
METCLFILKLTFIKGIGTPKKFINEILWKALVLPVSLFIYSSLSVYLYRERERERENQRKT